MRCDILTLFPDMVAPVLGQSILKRAQEKGLLHVHVRNLRDYMLDRHKVADDVPYGGGAGMVMKAEPILRAVGEIQRRLVHGPVNRSGCCFPPRRVVRSPRPMRKIWRPTRVDSSFSAATTKGSMNECGWLCIRKKYLSGIMC